MNKDTYSKLADLFPDKYAGKGRKGPKGRKGHKGRKGPKGQKNN